MWNRFKTLDPLLYIIPLLLVTVSVTTIFSLVQDGEGSALYLKQGLFGLLGFLAMAVLTFLNYQSLKAWAVWLYLAGLVGLGLVEFLGKSEFGAQRWFEVGFFRVQPGEVAKLTVAVALAALCSRQAELRFRRFLLAVAVLMVPAVTVLLQPDLGTALVITAIGLAIILAARISRLQRVLLITGVVAAIASVALSFHGTPPFTGLLKGYQKDRLASFLDPTRDPSKTGYNVIQSVIAVGSGGVTGKGFGGSQSQLNYLPVPHADFIFAVIAETWGLVGSIGVIALFVLLILRVLQAGRLAKDEFGALICVGVAAKLLIEMVVNIGMNIRVMPVTGIPLPFLSYGGTTMLVNAALIGLVQSIVIRYKRLTF